MRPMHTVIAIAVYCALLAGFSIALAADTLGTVVIDAGHGGYDHGIRVQDVREKDVTLDMARRLQRLFERGETYAYLSRKIDHYSTMEERWAVTTENKPEVFISIHVGAGSSFTVYTAWYDSADAAAGAVTGDLTNTAALAPADIYRVEARQRRYLAQSGALSSAVANAIAGEFETDVRRREFTLAVLDGVAAPAVLVEVPARGIDFDYDMGRVAGALYNGIMAYAR